MNENFDTSTPFGRAMIGILAVFAQLEREQIKERMMMGKEARAKEGKFAGSWAVPIGYDYIPEKDRLEINEYERMQVLDIFDMFFSGVPIKRMEKICMEKGFKHKHGTWNDKTIRNVMRSKTYLGMLKFRGDWVQGLHDPIISQATHEKAVRMLDERKEAYEKNRRPGKVQSFLGGLLVCKHCGAKYSKKLGGYKPKDGERIAYYYCNSRSKQSPKLVKDPNCKNNNWRMEILDQAVFDEIRKLGTDPAYFDTVIEEKKENNRPEIIRAEIERLDSQIGKLMDLYTVGNMPLDVIQGKIHEINDQKGNLENELEAIRREEQAALSRAETMEIVGSFGEVLESGDFHRIRAVVETLVDYVELDGDKVDIHWNFV
jgi:site-specific DNA recombinase